jgi:hypothetical protein
MPNWRMSFRVGNQGYEMWPDCLRLGVAAITYAPLAKVDLSKHLPGQPKDLWDRLEPTQKASLRRVAYEMRAGDVIYVKQGPRIVDRGVVIGPKNKNAYQFDSQFRLVDPNGEPWAHQVPVDWSKSFPETTVLLGAEQLTVKKLSVEEIETIEKRISIFDRGSPPSPHQSWTEPLLENAYYRETPARLKIIIPRHKKLSNDFCTWLRKQHGLNAVQERGYVDVQFNLKRETVLAELKVCFGVGTTKSIREALGQLLEYNHYPKRNPTDTWLLILDEEPSDEDRQFIEELRTTRSLPIRIGWQVNKNFIFFPQWP